MSSVTTSGATRSAFSFARIWDPVWHAGGVCCAVYRLRNFVPNFASFVNIEGAGAGDLDVRNGGLRHALLPGLRRF